MLERKKSSAIHRENSNWSDIREVKCANNTLMIDSSIPGLCEAVYMRMNVHLSIAHIDFSMKYLGCNISA